MATRRSKRESDVTSIFAWVERMKKLGKQKPRKIGKDFVEIDLKLPDVDLGTFVELLEDGIDEETGNYLMDAVNDAKEKIFGKHAVWAFSFEANDKAGNINSYLSRQTYGDLQHLLQRVRDSRDRRKARGDEQVTSDWRDMSIIATTRTAYGKNETVRKRRRAEAKRMREELRKARRR